MEFIRISRNTTSQPLVEQGLAFAYFLSRKRPGQATLVPPSSGGLAANTGIVSGGLTQKSITLTLLETSCEDAGIYHCYVSYQLGPFDNPDVIILNDYKTLTVTGKLLPLHRSSIFILGIIIEEKLHFKVFSVPYIF